MNKLLISSVFDYGFQQLERHHTDKIGVINIVINNLSRFIRVKIKYLTIIFTFYRDKICFQQIINK